MKAILNKLWSRKLAVTILAGVAVTVGTHLGLPEEAIVKYVNLAVAYILGQGAVDAATAIKNTNNITNEK